MEPKVKAEDCEVWGGMNSRTLLLLFGILCQPAGWPWPTIAFPLGCPSSISFLAPCFGQVAENQVSQKKLGRREEKPAKKKAGGSRGAMLCLAERSPAGAGGAAAQPRCMQGSRRPSSPPCCSTAVCCGQLGRSPSSPANRCALGHFLLSCRQPVLSDAAGPFC